MKSLAHCIQLLQEDPFYHDVQKHQPSPEEMPVNRGVLAIVENLFKEPINKFEFPWNKKGKSNVISISLPSNAEIIVQFNSSSSLNGMLTYWMASIPSCKKSNILIH